MFVPCAIATLPATPSLVPTCVNGQDANLPNNIHAVINRMVTVTCVGEDVNSLYEVDKRSSHLLGW